MEAGSETSGVGTHIGEEKPVTDIKFFNIHMRTDTIDLLKWFERGGCKRRGRGGGAGGGY